jgi:hypothetical protein
MNNGFYNEDWSCSSGSASESELKAWVDQIL